MVADMNSVAEVYEQLRMIPAKKGITLSISDDRSLITIAMGDDLVVTADDDMIGFKRKKKVLGLKCHTYSHTHPSDFYDIYQQLAQLLAADTV